MTTQTCHLSAAEQQDVLWSDVTSHNNNTLDKCPQERHWPTYTTIMSDINNSDYTHVLECPYDRVDPERDGDARTKKTGLAARMKSLKNINNNNNKTEVPSFCKALCAHGAACRAKMVLFPGPVGGDGDHPVPYTGLLAPDRTVEHCLLRLSSAAKPPAKELSSAVGRLVLGAVGGKLADAKLFPCVALKAFRGNGVRSGNLLFSGAKTGQPETDFFAHGLCTQVSERVTKALKPVIKKFYDYSDNPLSLGVSDFCSYGQEGDALPSDSESDCDVQFPYIVLLYPAYQTLKKETRTQNKTKSDIKSKNKKKTKEPNVPFDSFIADLLSIPEGSTLYDIFACPNPSAVLDATKLQRIGTIVTTSEMVPSGPDDGLFFRHQKKEEDFALRPEWKEEGRAECSPDGGKTTGSITKLAGWKILETHIKKGTYVDYEETAKA